MTDGTCSVGIDCPPNSRIVLGLCIKHYGQQYYQESKRRDPSSIRRVDRSPAGIAARFWSKVDKDGPVPAYRPDLGQCWLWSARSVREGYGSFSLGMRTLGAHRVAWELERGPIPAGYQIDHLCRVTLCVRPDHLEPVPPAENYRRGYGYSGLNARKTHCVKGHEYTPENTFIARGGGRRCRTCRPYQGMPHYETLKTHCPQGHPYAGENLYVMPKGGRVCRICARDRVRAYRAKRRREAVK